MDSRKILEIYKLINDRSPTLVSSWPTIADIPQGAIVLDTDGVVKQCRWVFYNAGADYINLGRPEWLNKFRPSIDSYSVCATILPTTQNVYRHIVALIDSIYTEQLQILINDADYPIGVSGKKAGNGVATSTTKITENAWNQITLGATPAAISIAVNGGTPIVGTAPQLVATTSDLYICNRYDAESAFEGGVAYVGFYDGDGVLVDAFDPNRNDLWDGSQTGYTVMGYPFTVANGSPLEIRVKALIPVSLL